MLISLFTVTLKVVVRGEGKNRPGQYYIHDVPLAFVGPCIKLLDNNVSYTTLQIFIAINSVSI